MKEIGEKTDKDNRWHEYNFFLIYGVTTKLSLSEYISSS